MLALASRVKPLKYRQSARISNLAQSVHCPVAFSQGVLFGLDKHQKRVYLVAGESLRGASGELVRVRLYPPDEPREPRVQEEND